MKYRLKSSTVEVTQWWKAGDHPLVTTDRVNDVIGTIWADSYDRHTLYIRPGDFIIEEPDWTIRVLNERLFLERYEPVEG